jgi:hypothetical protein
MGHLLLSPTFEFRFAWVVRAMVGARELTWRRTLLAVVVGVGLRTGPHGDYIGRCANHEPFE